jgi:hypothetical protein
VYTENRGALLADAENEESQRPCSLNEDSNGAERKSLGVTRELEQILRSERTARAAFDPRQRNRFWGDLCSERSQNRRKIAVAPRTTASEQRQLDSRSKQVK